MRKSLAMFLAIALVLTLVLPMTAFADKGKAKGKGLSVRGKIQIEGIVTGLNLGASMFSMRVTKRANRVGSGNVLVLVQRATELKVKHRGDDDDDDEDEDEHARRVASINDLQVGDRVKLDGFLLDDGRILALKLDIKNRRIAGPPEPEGVVAQGVVSAKGANTLTVVGAGGVTRVVVTVATDVRGHRNSFAAIQPTDVVVVQGTMNADGTVSARRIEVVFAGGTQMTGVIRVKSTAGPQFLILDNSLAVSIAGDTRIVSGGQLRSFTDLHVGQTITVSGDPIRIGGVMVGINARVISF